ncbi:hypothetical protein GXB85_06930 [Cellulomonas sp. APG4]|uniref:hypothetical protein n=1 Tax=Cellulomonas sp. APG4 TaxID=1538656 RepID=UPI0013798A12|nr:hypothetical protein [Cellulomonas sp. APG4]NCT90678.1 hypothetical protein [Cellulomonas sp. APG4]
MTRTTARRVRAALAAGALAMVAACSTPLPEPSPEPAPAVPPAAVSTEQVERILADLDAVLAAGDEAEDATALEPRIIGPAQTIREAQYLVGDEGEALTTIPTTAQTVAVEATDAWPRTMFLVTDPPEDLQAPLLLTLVQPTPRDQFRLWSWARLFPGVEMPATTQPQAGSTPVAVDDESLRLSPAATLAAYLDRLSRGTRSEHWETFGEDPLSTGIFQTRDAYRSLVEDKGSLTETHEALDSGPYAIGTADGGAIVVGSFRTVTTITLDDSTLTIGDETAELVGTDTLESNLTLSWVSVVAFHVPPAGSEEPVEVLGGEHVRVAVTGE